MKRQADPRQKGGNAKSRLQQALAHRKNQEPTSILGAKLEVLTAEKIVNPPQILWQHVLKLLHLQESTPDPERKYAHAMMSILLRPEVTAELVLDEVCEVLDKILRKDLLAHEICETALRAKYNAINTHMHKIDIKPQILSYTKNLYELFAAQQQEKLKKEYALRFLQALTKLVQSSPLAQVEYLVDLAQEIFRALPSDAEILNVLGVLVKNFIASPSEIAVQLRKFFEVLEHARINGRRSSPELAAAILGLLAYAQEFSIFSNEEINLVVDDINHLFSENLLLILKCLKIKLNNQNKKEAPQFLQEQIDGARLGDNAKNFCRYELARYYLTGGEIKKDLKKACQLYVEILNFEAKDADECSLQILVLANLANLFLEYADKLENNFLSEIIIVNDGSYFLRSIPDLLSFDNQTAKTILVRQWVNNYYQGLKVSSDRRINFFVFCQAFDNNLDQVYSNLSQEIMLLSLKGEVHLEQAVSVLNSMANLVNQQECKLNILEKSVFLSFVSVGEYIKKGTSLTDLNFINLLSLISKHVGKIFLSPQLAWNILDFFKIIQKDFAVSPQLYELLEKFLGKTDSQMQAEELAAPKEPPAVSAAAPLVADVPKVVPKKGPTPPAAQVKSEKVFKPMPQEVRDEIARRQEKHEKDRLEAEQEFFAREELRKKKLLERNLLQENKKEFAQKQKFIALYI